MTKPIDRRLVPDGWRPHQGARVRINAPTNPAPDDPPPPPGVWWVSSAAPEAGHYWLFPDDGEARTWAVVQMAGRVKAQWPAGWPAQDVHGRRLVPAGMAAPLW